jgi:hypothetical protein
LNDECRMSNDERNPNDEVRNVADPKAKPFSFWLRHSFVIRHSCFVILAVLICGKDEAN